MLMLMVFNKIFFVLFSAGWFECVCDSLFRSPFFVSVRVYFTHLCRRYKCGCLCQCVSCDDIEFTKTKNQFNANVAYA